MLISVKRIRREDLYSFWQKTSVDEKDVLKTWIIGGIFGRRPSPLMLKIGDSTAYLSVFVSADWPRELGWRKIQIEEAILATTARVLTEFEDYVKKLGGEVEMIWPPEI
jgi:hypothetical protein